MVFDPLQALYYQFRCQFAILRLDELFQALIYLWLELLEKRVAFDGLFFAFTDEFACMLLCKVWEELCELSWGTEIF